MKQFTMWKTERDHCSLSLSTVVYYSKVFTFCLAIFVSGKVCGVTKKAIFLMNARAKTNFVSPPHRLQPKQHLWHFLFVISLGMRFFFHFKVPYIRRANHTIFTSFYLLKSIKGGGNSECVEMILVSIQQAGFIYEAWQAVDMPWI